MLVLLGEVGGVEEYEVCEALQSKRITKPIVAWCIGTCAGEMRGWSYITTLHLHLIKI